MIKGLAGFRILALSMTFVTLVSCGSKLIYVTDPATTLFLKVAGLSNDTLTNIAAEQGYRLNLVDFDSPEAAGLLITDQLDPQKTVIFSYNPTIPQATLDALTIFPPRLNYFQYRLSPAAFDKLATYASAAKRKPNGIFLIVAPNNLLSVEVAKAFEKAAWAHRLTFSRIEVAAFDLAALRDRLAATRGNLVILTGAVTDKNIWNEINAPEYRIVIWGGAALGSSIAGCVGSIDINYPELWKTYLSVIKSGQKQKIRETIVPTNFYLYK